MAKLYGARKIVKAVQQRKDYSHISEAIIDEQIRRKEKSNKKPVLGIKASVLNVYEEKGKHAAWEALQERNKKLEGVEYTLEMLEKWIEEYEKRNGITKKVEKKDDEPDR